MKIVTAFSLLDCHREVQHETLKSWRRLGYEVVGQNRADEIENLKGIYLLDDWVACEDVNPYQRIYNLCTLHEPPYLLLNSDIGLRSAVPNYPVLIQRWNIDGEEKWIEPWGIDGVTVTEELQSNFPNLSLSIGKPVWDYWILRHTYKTHRVFAEGVEHQHHETQWSRGNWFINALEVSQEYGWPTPPHMHTLRRYVERPNRILIACSPRTGSNLLMRALEQHPSARSAGELFCNEERHSILHERSRPLWEERCNLFKLFSGFHTYHISQRLLSNCTVVYLYRKDIEAQLASWKRAASTGQWTSEGDGIKTIYPKDAHLWPKWAEEKFKPFADMSIAYEDMIDHWDSTIASILEKVGWGQICLPMTLSKQ